MGGVVVLKILCRFFGFFGSAVGSVRLVRWLVGSCWFVLVRGSWFVVRGWLVRFGSWFVVNYYIIEYTFIYYFGSVRFCRWFGIFQRKKAIKKLLKTFAKPCYHWVHTQL